MGYDGGALQAGTVLIYNMLGKFEILGAGRRTALGSVNYYSGMMHHVFLE